jgi:hypothetical protein
MAEFDKHFTVEEANALLPELRLLIAQIQALRDRLVIERENLAPVLSAVHTNGGGKEASAFVSTLGDLNSRIRRLASIGVQLKSLDRGLVDFPAWRDDREVFLCWHLDEESVTHWHDLESGFAGREPL